MTTTSSRERHSEEEEGHDDRWLITYADMITLLLAVFIVLYSFSVVDLKKFEAVAGALGDQFQGSAGGGMLGGGQSILPGGTGVTTSPATFVNNAKRAIERDLPEELRRSLVVTCRGGTVTISMKADTITFPLGEARLTAGVRQILDALGPLLQETMAPLYIEGHTCDLPINTPSFPSNWELSAQRATTVMVYLIRTWGVEPDRICAAGYADTRPLETNETEEGRRCNRRVDIVMYMDRDDVGKRHGAVMSSDTMQSSEQGRQRDMRLLPVQLAPTIDLGARYFEHTGRRVADTPASQSRREVH